MIQLGELPNFHPQSTESTSDLADTASWSRNLPASQNWDLNVTLDLTFLVYLATLSTLHFACLQTSLTPAYPTFTHKPVNQLSNTLPSMVR